MGKGEGVKVRRAVFLKNLAQYDPDLAQELAISEEPVEAIIAQELSAWRLVKNERLKQMDMETLMAAWDFFKDMMKLALQMYTTANQMFFNQFLQQYEYTALAVQEKLKNQNQPDPKALLTLKTMEIIDSVTEQIKKMQESLYNVGMSVKVEKGGDSSGGSKEGGRRSSKKLSTSSR